MLTIIEVHNPTVDFYSFCKKKKMFKSPTLGDLTFALKFSQSYFKIKKKSVKVHFKFTAGKEDLLLSQDFFFLFYYHKI